MTPIAIEHSQDTYNISVPRNSTSGTTSVVTIISIAKSPYSEVPSDDVLESVKELKKHKKRGATKVYGTVGEIKKAFG